METPTVTTTTTSNIYWTQALFHGAITDLGGWVNFRRGFCYIVGTSGDPTVADSVVDESGSFPTGDFALWCYTLTAGTNYRIRAFSESSQGIGYGNTVDFSTLALVAPIVTTQAATAIEKTTATGNGTVVHNGGSAMTFRGICYNTTGNPVAGGGDPYVYDELNVEGAFAMSLTGLLPRTKYYCKAFAINGVGTGYGDEINFTTMGKGVVLPW